LHRLFQDFRGHHVLRRLVVYTHKVHVFVRFDAFAAAGSGSHYRLIQLVGFLQSLLLGQVCAAVVVKVVVRADLRLVVVDGDELVAALMLPELNVLHRRTPTVHS